MKFELPIDPRLQNVDAELAKIVFDEFKKNLDLVGIHLRDARNILYAIRQLRGERVFSKAAILLASAALESNLAYLSKVALRFIEKRPEKFVKPQIDYLHGFKEVIDDRGQIVKQPLKQALIERLEIVPALLARAIDRHYRLPVYSAPFRKLRRRRDAIVHPRWDKYVVEIGWWEAAEAIDAVELYLESVRDCMHPYAVGYLTMLLTIRGPSKDDVGVGHRTYGKRGPNRKISTMEEVGINEVLVNEWMDSMFFTQLAFAHDCEGDSPGSMFTRAALVLLYAMLDAQLAVVSQWRLHEDPSRFHEAEILFLNEFAVGIGHNGEVWVGDDVQSFKTRIKAVPAILSRRVDRNEFAINLGTTWGESLLKGHVLRNKVMHSAPGEQLPRVSKEELLVSAKAIRSYFVELAKNAPTSFGYAAVLMKDTEDFLKPSL